MDIAAPSDVVLTEHFTLVEVADVSTEEQEVERLLRELEGKRRIPAKRLARDVQAVQSENAVLTGHLQEVAADVQGLQAALAEAAEARSQDQRQLEEERARTQQMARDVQAVQSENAVLRGHLQEVAADVQGLRSALQAALAEAAAARSQNQSQLEEERARTQQIAADVQGLRSALQTALDVAAEARSQDRSQLEEERARTQQLVADVQGLRSALQAALDEAAAAQSQNQSQSEEERARTQQMAAELRRVRQELEDQHKALEEVQSSNEQGVAELQKTRKELGDQCKVLNEEQSRGQKALEHLQMLHNGGIPEFSPDPVPGLRYSRLNRRCTRFSGQDLWVSAMAPEGFSSGTLQFTVHIVVPGRHLMIGVSTPTAPRFHEPHWHGLFLNNNDGKIHGRDKLHQPYTSELPFPSNSLVTMRLDFATRMASWEVNGRGLGVVVCPLPPGPLHPAVLFYSAGQVVEFVSLLRP